LSNLNQPPSVPALKEEKSTRVESVPPIGDLSLDTIPAIPRTSQLFSSTWNKLSGGDTEMAYRWIKVRKINGSDEFFTPF